MSRSVYQRDGAVTDILGELFDVMSAPVSHMKTIDMVTWILENTRLNGRPISFAGHEYQIDIINDMYPRQCIEKASQMGLTEMLTRKFFAFLVRHPGAKGIFTMPSASEVSKFSKDRIASLIEGSPVLSSLRAEPDTDSIKRFGQSVAYFKGRSGEKQAISIPAEIVVHDECNFGSIEILKKFRSRLRKASIVPGGLEINVSTPTLPKFGISQMFRGTIDEATDGSDQRYWHIKCTRCNHWQQLTYPDSIHGFYERGRMKTADIYYQCLKCGGRFDFATIGDWKVNEPSKTTNCQWVAKYPHRTKDEFGMRGYHIDGLMGYHWTSAEQLLHQRDEAYETDGDFTNFVLGLPAIGSNKKIDAGILYRQMSSDISWESSGKACFMGADQGSYIVIGRIQPNSRTDKNPIGNLDIIHIEHVVDEDAFDGFDESGIKNGQLSKLMDEYDVSTAVIDNQPNRVVANRFKERFPARVWTCNSHGSTLTKPLFVNEDEHTLEENRDDSLDLLNDQLTAKRISFPGEMTDDLRILFEHAQNLVRLKTDNTKDIYKTKTRRPGYVCLGPDHYWQAVKYLVLASLMDQYRPQIAHFLNPFITGIDNAAL